jgi:ATP-dependent RNA helicase DDX24/MAK5
MGDNVGEEAERFAPKGLLRALIITPTRELAIQVVIILNEILSSDPEFSNMLLGSANLALSDLKFSCGSSFYPFQVTDHFKEAAHGINIRVVSIVGGMSTEKQERLLKARPEIIVGTPGRLWELMSGGEKHLVEVSDCM